MTDFELYEYSENKLKEKEKRIAELERENAELKSNNNVYCEGEGETLVVNVSFDKFTRINANHKMYYPCNEEFEKENTELKNEVYTWKEASSTNSYKAFQLQEENKELIGEIAFTENALNNAKAQIEKMKCWCNCKKYISCLEECCRKNISFEQGICYNCKKWEIREK